jgi:cytochrome c-type biogenesis protein CcmE
MKTYGKFALLVVAIVGTLAWLALGGINEGKTYYKTIHELAQMGDNAYGKKIRVGGDVEPGSISRSGREVRFTLIQENRKLNVIYRGSDPLPDTFRDSAQALADGKLAHDGTFEAQKIQAKCASKYEQKPGGAVHPDGVKRAAM